MKTLALFLALTTVGFAQQAPTPTSADIAKDYQLLATQQQVLYLKLDHNSDFLAYIANQKRLDEIQKQYQAAAAAEAAAKPKPEPAKK